MKKIMYPRSMKDIKGKVAIAELRRAHIIITLLAMMLAVILMFAMLDVFMVDQTLGAIAVAALLIVAGSSAATAAGLAIKK